jgi:hypothetical protein
MPRAMESDPMTQNRTDGTYDIGFCKPPEHTRFRKGESGNRKGRPKRALHLAAVLERILREKVVPNENGRRKVVTKFEAALSQLANKAVSGDGRAVKHLCQLFRSAEEQSVAVEPTTQLSEADRKVWDNILRRFQQPSKENSDDTNQK